MSIINWLKGYLHEDNIGARHWTEDGDKSRKRRKSCRVFSSQWRIFLRQHGGGGREWRHRRRAASPWRICSILWSRHNSGYCSNTSIWISMAYLPRPRSREVIPSPSRLRRLLREGSISRRAVLGWRGGWVFRRHLGLRVSRKELLFPPRLRFDGGVAAVVATWENGSRTRLNIDLLTFEWETKKWRIVMREREIVGIYLFEIPMLRLHVSYLPLFICVYIYVFWTNMCLNMFQRKKNYL